MSIVRTRRHRAPDEEDARYLVDCVRAVLGLGPLYDRSGEHKTDLFRFGGIAVEDDLLDLRRTNE